jgi:hypothetical protein
MGVIQWEIKDDTSGVESISDNGEVFPVNKGTFSIRSVCFQSYDKYRLWYENKSDNEKLITASSSWYSINVEDSKGEANVKTQTDLNKALSSDKFTQITLSSEVETEFTIDEGNYENINLVINAPKAEIKNFALFKTINIQALKDNTWYENAKGNTFNITSIKIRIVVNGIAEVKEIFLNQEDTEVNLDVDGIIQKLTIRRSSLVNFTGDGDMLPITIEKTAEGSKIVSSIPIDVEVDGNAEFIFNAGSEGSKVNKSNKTIELKVENNSKQDITITTNHTNEEVIHSGESGLNKGEDQKTDTVSGGESVNYFV